MSIRWGRRHAGVPASLKGRTVNPSPTVVYSGYSFSHSNCHFSWDYCFKYFGMRVWERLNASSSPWCPGNKNTFLQYISSSSGFTMSFSPFYVWIKIIKFWLWESSSLKWATSSFQVTSTYHFSSTKRTLQSPPSLPHKLQRKKSHILLEEGDGYWCPPVPCSGGRQ